MGDSKQRKKEEKGIEEGIEEEEMEGVFYETARGSGAQDKGWRGKRKRR